MEYCPHCMRPAIGTVCASCGGSINWTAAPGQLPVGTLLQGSDGHTYQIGAARGQGGFGITYAALDLTTNGRVAIKEYFPTRCAQRNQVNQVIPHTGQAEIYRGGMKSFLEEAMMLSAVGALPSVVTVHDCFEGNGTAYIVMEFVDGMPLHQVVAQKGRMSAEELLPKLPALLQDFAILHKAGVIHRDISPDNLILMPNGALKILDFGSARSLQDGKSMSVLLKEGFSPVEQYMSRGQGPYTDVYALAATLYYCLTGTLPPPSVTRLEQDTLQRPNALGAGLTAEQEEAILCGLIVQPKSRTASMELFRERLFPAGAVSKHSAASEHIAFTQKEADPGTGSSFRTESLDASGEAEKSAEGTAEVKVETTASAAVKRRPEKKKLIAIVAAALLLIGVGGFYFATHGTTDDGFRYKLSGGEATITGYRGDSDMVLIPAQIKDHPVEWIDKNAFAGHSEIVTLTVRADAYPDMGALNGCDGITLVAFENEEGTDWWESELSSLPSLRCVFLNAENTFRENADGLKETCGEDIAVCYLGQDTGYGRIQSVEVKAGIVYAYTDADNAVLLGLPENVDVTALPSALGSRQVILPDGRLAGRNAYYTEDENGYVYLVDEDAGCVTITGYKGSEDIPVMDDYFAGYPITKIGKNAFAGNETITTAGFPAELVEVQSGAFRNCTNLGTLALFGEVSFAADAFVGCGKLRCAMVPAGVSVDTSVLPQNFKVYDYGMETGAGKLTFPHVADDGTIYGLTENDRLAVLDIAGGAAVAETVMDYPVTWVHKDAVSDVSSHAQITVPGSVLVAPEICDAVQWKVEDIHSDAWAWIWSNRVCARVNSAVGKTVASVDSNLLDAMQIRAKELSQSDSHTRPNGKGWDTALNECKVDWDFGYVSKRAYTGKCTDIPEEYLDELQKMYAVQEVESNNRYYNYIAVSAYYNAETNTTHISCCAVIR